MREFIAVAAFAGIVGLFLFPNRDEEIPTYHVAFMGNSFTFVNDLPRLMESLSNAGKSHHLVQNSCLHSSLNFRTLSRKGNGMYAKWSTQNALLNDSYPVYYIESDDDYSYEVADATQPLYDYGACTVKQLLFGYDADLTLQNKNGAYYDDGTNPCIQDPTYFMYLQEKYQKEKPQWDFVVMNDHSTYPGVIEKRQKSLQALKKYYADWFVQSETARPVLLATYAYIKAEYRENNDDDRSNDDDYCSWDVYDMLGDVPEFTSRIWYGYNQYAELLSRLLPKYQKPIIAPVGPAFLLLYEENQAMWENQMFQDDGFHPSPHGTFLIGCVLYATLYGRLPSSTIFNPGNDVNYENDNNINYYNNNNSGTMWHLWSRARMMQRKSSMGDDKPYPTLEEAMYLMEIAERVVLRGHVPNTLLPLDTVAKMEESEEYDDDYAQE